MHQAWKTVELELRPRRSRTAVFALVLASLVGLILAAARLFYSISFGTPLQFTTSGAEEEALASIWRFIHDQTVYTDPRLLPYTASYFNWLFYASYGTIAGAALRLLGLQDAWLPTICRLITLTVAATGAGIFVRLVRKQTDGRLSRIFSVVLAGLAFFNPLCGFWVITTRPDVAAAVLELGAVAAFLGFRRTENKLQFVLPALLLGAAWAFKQTTLGALVGLMLALIFAGGQTCSPKAHIARTLGLALPILVGAVLLCVTLGSVFRHGLYFSQIHSGFQVSWALHHFGEALLKMPFIAMALGGAAWTWRRSDLELRAITWVLISTFFIELSASSKGGAGDYYFLSLGVWSVLWITLALDRYPSPVLDRAVLAAALLQVSAVVAVFAFHRGIIDPRDPAQRYKHLAQYLAGRPGPVLVQDTYGDLPWISPAAPQFVIAYNNQVDALAGVTFQEGGWPGLLAHGYFATVVTRATPGEITAALLERYRFVREETGWRYYQRRDRGEALTSPEKNRAAFR